MSSAVLPDVPTANADDPPSRKARAKAFFLKNFFLIGLVLVVLFGALVPDVGHKEGPLAPKITASWIGVIVIFLISGLGVKSKELKRATLFWQLNIFVHFFIYIFYPLVGLFVRWLLLYTDLNEALLDGLLIALCLPTTISSAVVLTLNSLGNEAAAVINTAMSNMLGIVLTPALILIFLGNLGSVSIGEIFFKLTMRVIVPFATGQIVRNYDNIRDKFVPSKAANNKDDKNHMTMVQRITKHKKKLKKVSEVLLLYIVFCAISESFYTGVEAEAWEVVVMLFIVGALHCLCLVVVWHLSGLNENRREKLKKKRLESSAAASAAAQDGMDAQGKDAASVTVTLKGGDDNNKVSDANNNHLQVHKQPERVASTSQCKIDPGVAETDVKNDNDAVDDENGLFMKCFGWLYLDFNIYDRVAILFCATQKTAAFGVPMIATLYEDNENLGLFTVPLLLFHPLQLVIDSFLVTPLQKKVLAFEAKYGKDYFNKLQKLKTQPQLKKVQSEQIDKNTGQGGQGEDRMGKEEMQATEGTEDEDEEIVSDDDFDSSAAKSDEVMLGRKRDKNVKNGAATGASTGADANKSNFERQGMNGMKNGAETTVEHGIVDEDDELHQSSANNNGDN